MSLFSYIENSNVSINDLWKGRFYQRTNILTYDSKTRKWAFKNLNPLDRAIRSLINFVTFGYCFQSTSFSFVANQIKYEIGLKGLEDNSRLYCLVHRVATIKNDKQWMQQIEKINRVFRKQLGKNQELAKVILESFINEMTSSIPSKVLIKRKDDQIILIYEGKEISILDFFSGIDWNSTNIELTQKQVYFFLNKSILLEDGVNEIKKEFPFDLDFTGKPTKYKEFAFARKAYVEWELFYPMNRLLREGIVTNRDLYDKVTVISMNFSERLDIKVSFLLMKFVLIQTFVNFYF